MVPAGRRDPFGALSSVFRRHHEEGRMGETHTLFSPLRSSRRRATWSVPNEKRRRA